jgi:hypothetical protein
VRSCAQSTVKIINREMQLTELFASRTQNIDAKTFGAKEGLSEYQAQSLQWVCSPRLILSPGPSSAYN